MEGQRILWDLARYLYISVVYEGNETFDPLAQAASRGQFQRLIQDLGLDDPSPDHAKANNRIAGLIVAPEISSRPNLRPIKGIAVSIFDAQSLVKVGHFHAQSGDRGKTSDGVSCSLLIAEASLDVVGAIYPARRHACTKSSEVVVRPM